MANKLKDTFLVKYLIQYGGQIAPGDLQADPELRASQVKMLKQNSNLDLFKAVKENDLRLF